MFLSLVLSGEADDTEDDSYIRRLSTSICQDLVYGLIKADNIDIIEETLDGTGTFHATQMVVHQRGISDKHHHDIPIAKDTSFKIPEEFNKIDPAPFHRGRTSPVLNKELNHEWFNPDVKQAELANIKDIIWILTKLHDPEHNVP
ncbi:uncharacterized protein LOC117102801 isoform X2 [Anneissia japonica]|uniref:uncharacterized protein LOC117102801 isoform X2 n=1 Tax=Anneissia japonica TaxID=1529436 RepID=UPI001425797D|nr:uncharacterized protein LOC117102801 isoform X2 [Anneissia japonica]